MQSITEKQSLFWGPVIFAAALIAGFFLHFTSLNGVIYLSEDEARPFTLMGSGQFIYILCRPVYNFFGTQDAVFRFTGFLSWMTIPVYYLFLRFFSDKLTASVAVLLYAVWPLRINFARTLFPSVYVEFFIALAVLFVGMAYQKKRLPLIAIAGIFCGLAFLSHTFSYAAIFGVGCFVLAAFLKEGPVKSMQACLILFFSYLTVLCITALYLYCFKNGYGLFDELFRFGQYTNTWSQLQGGMYDRLIRYVTRLPQASFLAVFSSAAVIIFLISGLRNKSHTMFYLLPFIIGLLTLLSAAVFQIHTLYPRHFAWLGLLTAFAVSSLLLQHRFGKILLIPFLIFLFYESSMIAKETFSIHPIRDYLRENRIPKNRILTSWWQINARGDRFFSDFVPGGMAEGDPDDRSSLIVSRKQGKLLSQRFAVHWPEVKRRYDQGRAEYLLTSGLDLRASLGESEELLQGVEPVKSWKHPYEVSVRRPYESFRKKIHLYRLKDIFKTG